MLLPGNNYRISIVVELRKNYILFVELGIHEDFEPDYELKFIFMKRFFLFSALAVCLALAGCNERQEHSLSSVAQMPVSADTVVPVVEVPRKRSC